MIMTVGPCIPGRLHGAWMAACSRCDWDRHVYCTETAARQGAADHLWSHRPLPNCPTTGKKSHRTRDEALEHIRRLYKAGRGNPDYRPYECGQHWHIGHSRESLQKRIRTAVGGRRRRRHR